MPAVLWKAGLSTNGRASCCVQRKSRVGDVCFEGLHYCAFSLAGDNASVHPNRILWMLEKSKTFQSVSTILPISMICRSKRLWTFVGYFRRTFDIAKKSRANALTWINILRPCLVIRRASLVAIVYQLVPHRIELLATKCRSKRFDLLDLWRCPSFTIALAKPWMRSLRWASLVPYICKFKTINKKRKIIIYEIL